MKTIYLTLMLALASVLTYAQPNIKTDTRYARGATKAFGRMTLSLNGASMKECGFCWSSESNEPTVDDNKSTKKWANNGAIFVMENLTPATMYYARAYVTTEAGATYYGDAIKFCTVPKGTIEWHYDNGGSAEENDRINSAVALCVDYWNNYTSIPDLYLKVYYNAQTPTIGYNYDDGLLVIGSNASYQKTGSIMHGALHLIGVGTCDLWNGATSPLRAGAGTGEWLGDRANDFLKFWDNSAQAALNGDGNHFWPYGINGAAEDTGSELLYAANSMIAQALCEDGLPRPNTRRFGLPHYSFNQEDTIKYYIRNEDESRGLTTSFLVETADHKLMWKEMLAAEAVADNAAAWYVTFTPENQLYQLMNAATGNYITYNNGIGCEAAYGANSKNSFCLMRSRIDVTSNDGAKLTTERGYWVIVPEYENATPPCLEAGLNGTVTTIPYNNLNTAKRQRWLILNDAQAKAMENSGLIAARDAFDKGYQSALSIFETPHASISGDADVTLNSHLFDIKARYDAAMTVNEVTELTAELRAALMEFLGNVYVTDLENPFNLTSMMANPDFASDTSGWTVGSGGTYDYGEVEFYVDLAKTASLIQLVKNMPSGTYRLSAQGFQRPGANNQVYSDYTAGTDNVKVALEMTMAQRSFAKQNVKNIMAERQRSQVHSGDTRLSDGTYVPNTMAAARAHFDKGYYDNSITGYTSYSGDLRIYFRGDNSAASSWTICDNFRLHYFGGLTLEEIEQNLAEDTINVDANRVIYYTSSDGEPITPYNPDAFGVNIVSNTYVKGLGKIIFDGEVTSIGDWAFYGCSSLTTVEIPASVTSIEYYGFQGCSSLKEVTCKAVTPPSCTKDAFYKTPIAACVLKVPIASVGLYSTTEPWSLFGTIVTISGSKLPCVTFAYDNPTLTLANDVETATIYYKFETDETFSVYSNPITLTDNRNVFAYAAAEGFENSDTISFATDHFACAEIQLTYDNVNGTYTISCDEPDARLTLAINGSEMMVENDGRYYLHDIMRIAHGDSIGRIQLFATARKQYKHDSLTPVTNVRGFNREKKYLGHYDNSIAPRVEIDAYVFEPGGLDYGLKWGLWDKILIRLNVHGDINAEDIISINNSYPLALDLSDASYVGEQSAILASERLASVKWDSQSQPKSSGLAGVVDITTENPNFLFYCTDRSFAPEGIRNVVVNGEIDEIALAEGGNFWSIEEFCAGRICYDHSYTMQSGKGFAQGWEGLALPFDVQTIWHKTATTEIASFKELEDNGITEFNRYSPVKPFWLYKAAGFDGFAPADRIQANTPYLISMPNNDNYVEALRLPGVVSFRAKSATIPESTVNAEGCADYTFVPATFACNVQDQILALNVNEVYGEHPEGSVFLRNYRTIRPFEAYLYSLEYSNSHSPVRLDGIIGETTGIATTQNSSPKTQNSHNLLGLPVDKSYKGIVIEGGRKIVRR